MATTLRVVFEWKIPPQAKRAGVLGTLQNRTLRAGVFTTAAPLFLKEMARLGLAPGEAEVTVEYGTRALQAQKTVRALRSLKKAAG